MKDVAVVIMTYKSTLSDLERISFDRCIDVFSNRDIFVVGPWNISKDEYIKLNGDRAKLNFVDFDPKWFKNTFTYSKMLMQEWFYNLFFNYKYILIYQLDCYVFQDKLDYFIGLDYDYYGASWAWSNVFGCVGNGGFSLRKISAFLENLKERKDLDYINSDECTYFIEDFAYCTGFYPLKNICPFHVAEKFSFETSMLLVDPEKMKLEDFPMGIHGFSKEDEINYLGQIYSLKGVMSKAIKRWDELNNEKTL